MFQNLLIPITIIFWCLILYFIGIRRYSHLLQNIFNGRLIRRSIGYITVSPLKSTFSGFLTSFLIQSSYAAQSHARSYADSGLLTVRQLGYYLVGSHWGNVLAAALFLFVPDLPNRLVVGTLVLSFFFKIFFAKFRFLLVNFFFVVSAIILSMSSLRQLQVLVVDSHQLYQDSVTVFCIAFVLAMIFKSSLLNLILAVLFLFLDENIANIILFCAGTHIGLSTAQWFYSVKSNRLVKFSYTLQWFTFVGGAVGLYLIEPYLDIVGPISFLFSKLNIHETVWLSSVIHILWINLIYVFVVTLSMTIFLVILGPRMESFLKSPKRAKEMQKFIFPKGFSFYSPFLYVDHLRQELKKMSAMVQTSLQSLSELINSNDPEQLLRVKKYNLILLKVREEIKEYSYKSLNRIQVPFTNQENLHLLQLSECLEKISNLSIDLLETETRGALTAQDVKYLLGVNKNYDYVFEAFATDSVSIYPSTINSPQEKTKGTEIIDAIHINVLELANILKNINDLKRRTAS